VERDASLGPAEELEDPDLHASTISAATGEVPLFRREH
jgi:hypothetical protein